MVHLSYEDSKKLATKTIIILGIITICEVAFALLGKGYVIEGVHFPAWITGGVMIIIASALGLTNYMVDAQLASRLTNFVSEYIDSRITFLLDCINFLISLMMTTDSFAVSSTACKMYIIQSSHC